MTADDTLKTFTSEQLLLLCSAFEQLATYLADVAEASALKDPMAIAEDMMETAKAKGDNAAFAEAIGLFTRINEAKEKALARK
jgi:hypothetical protein